MAAYFCLILIIIMDFSLENLFFCNLNKIKSERTKKIFEFVFHWRIISIVAMVFISTFRSYSVGLDTKNYVSYYESLKNNADFLFKKSISSKWEIGFTFLNSIFAMLGVNYRVLLFFIYSFVSISIVFFSNKISEDKVLSLILYIALGVFAQGLNTIRQIIAMVIILYVIILLIDKKYMWLSVLLTFVASLFHVSAIFCLIFIVIRYIKPKWWVVTIMFGLTIIGSFLFPYIMKVVEELTPLDYYSRYFVNYKGFIVESDLLNNLYSIALILLFFILYLAKFKFLQLNNKQKEQYDFFIMIFIFVPMIRIAGFILNAQALFNRLSMYFFMILIVLVPLFVQGVKYNQKRYYATLIMIYIVAFGYMYYLYAIKLSCGVVPYVLGV